MAIASRQAPSPVSARQERLMRLGRLADSAGLTVAQLQLLAEARRTRAFASAMAEDNAAFAAWLAKGAPDEAAPDPEAALTRWQAEARATRARAQALSKPPRDARWLGWIRALPTPQHPAPTALETYLASLQQALENRPDLLDGLAADTRQALNDALALHTDMIQYELDREAGAIEASLLADLLGKAGGALGIASPEAKAGGKALGFLAAIPHRRQMARLKQLRHKALIVRRLLLNLREQLVHLP